MFILQVHCFCQISSVRNLSAVKNCSYRHGHKNCTFPVRKSLTMSRNPNRVQLETSVWILFDRCAFSNSVCFPDQSPRIVFLLKRKITGNNNNDVGKNTRNMRIGDKLKNNCLKIERAPA